MPDRIPDHLITIAGGVKEGRHRAIARAISIVESATPESDLLLHALAEGHGTATRVIGITGPPGAGKSTLLNGLVDAARSAGRRVAVLAVDPSSPFSGGALLGDRVRMTRHGADDGVFIRSMATRGHGGGLSAASLETVTVLTAAGFEDIFVESVGVGQSEVGILSLADLVLLVMNPGAGDEIQALKAGVMEIGDIYVINKCDYPGVEKLERELAEVIREHPRSSIPPEIRRTVAVTGDGVSELYGKIGTHLAKLEDAGELLERRQRRIGDALVETASGLFRRWIRERGIVDPREGVPFAVIRRRLAEVLEKIDTEYGGHHDRTD
ncbi:MAG: methylmalonyl Co-A mutase-associated GTPase MeaB [Alkalispirochaeta sp.]